MSTKDDNPEDEEIQNERNNQQDVLAIRRDLIVISGGFALLYLGLGSSEDVQRALNPGKGLQLTVRGLFIFSRLISCALLPTVAIEKLGSKGALLVGYGVHFVYLLATLDPRFSTLIPCSIAAGVTNPLLWTSLGIYVTSLAIGYSKNPLKVKQPSKEPAVNRFFAVFFAVLFFSYAIPAILASVVLNPKVKGKISSEQIGICGASYCNEKLQSEEECVVEEKIPSAQEISSSTAFPVNESKVLNCQTDIYNSPPFDHAYYIGGTYVVFAIFGFGIIFCFLRNIVTGQSTTKSDAQFSIKRSILDSLGATFEILHDNPVMFLLAFTASTYGLTEYFFVYDFPKAFVVCVDGYHAQGFLLFSGALAASATSIGVLLVHSSFCRLWMTGVSTFLVFICILPLFLWKPSQNSIGVAFPLTICWGCVTSLWNIHLSGVHGHLGRRQMSASFSNLLFWWTLGQMLGFLWSELVCFQHKLYVLTPLLAGPTLAMLALEIWLRPPFFISRQKVYPAKLDNPDERGVPEGASRNSPKIRQKKPSKALSVTESGSGFGVSTIDKLASKIKRDSLHKPTSRTADPSPTAPPPDVINNEVTSKVDEGKNLDLE